MNTTKYSILSLVLLLFIIFSCNNNFGEPNPFEGVDYEELAKKDNDSIVRFLKTHYYDESDDSFKDLVDGETAVFDAGNNLKQQKIVANNIEHTLYTFILNEGIGDPEKEQEGFFKPTNMDSLLVNSFFRILNPNSDVQRLRETVFNGLSTEIFEVSQQTWIPLDDILGTNFGYTNFKPGENVTANGDRLSFNEPGKGYIFIPSGLAFPANDFDPNFQQSNPFFNNILVYKVELLDFVPNTDHDNDGIPSIFEDANCDGNPRNDFSDKNLPALVDFLNTEIAEKRNCSN